MRIRVPLLSFINDAVGPLAIGGVALAAVFAWGGAPQYSRLRGRHYREWREGRVEVHWAQSKRGHFYANPRVGVWLYTECQEYTPNKLTARKNVNPELREVYVYCKYEIKDEFSNKVC